METEKDLIPVEDEDILPEITINSRIHELLLKNQRDKEDLDYIQSKVAKNSEKISHPDDNEEELIGTRVTAYFMTQFSLKKGLNVLGKEGENAIKKELCQLHLLQVFTQQMELDLQR